MHFWKTSDHVWASIDLQYSVIFISPSSVSSYLLFSSTTCSFVYSSSPLTEQFGWRYWRLLFWIPPTDSSGTFIKSHKFVLFYFQYISGILNQDRFPLHTNTYSLVKWKKNSIHFLLWLSFAVIRISRSFDLFQTPVIYKEHWKKEFDL